MSKITKLITQPRRFFFDALKKRIEPSNPGVAKPYKAKAADKAEATGKASENGASREGLAVSQLLKNILLDGEHDVLKKAWTKAFANARNTADSVALLAVRAEAELAVGNHEALAEFANRMVNEYGSPIGRFYLAQSSFVRGRFQDAIRELSTLLYESPDDPDATFLLCETVERTGENEIGWRALEQLVSTSKRAKLWHMMSGLVQNNGDMIRMLALWNNFKATKIGKNFDHNANEFLALGAMRVENSELARQIWRDTLRDALALKKGITSLKVRSPSYSGRRAEKALSDINNMCAAAGIEMFLVSGTLLGCVRENRLLSHDKDIDIGIWDTVEYDTFMDVAVKSGLFFTLKSRTREIIRLRHVNGIAIDVFYHYRDPDDYWHGGVKMVWHNKPFNLVKRSFLDDQYLIPENYDLYLTENYGDWRTPKIDFDSAFDTPNGEARDDNEMAIHSFRGLLGACIDMKWNKAGVYLTRLRQYGESSFADVFTKDLLVRQNLLHEDLYPAGTTPA